MLVMRDLGAQVTSIEIMSYAKLALSPGLYLSLQRSVAWWRRGEGNSLLLVRVWILQ